MSVVIIDSGGANLGSIRYACARLGADAVISRDAATIRAASHVILPGVGAAGPAMSRLLAAGLERLIPALTQPVLAICLGMQLLYEASDEDGTRCLGILPGTVRRLPLRDGIRVPHMGWNRLRWVSEDEPLARAMGGAPWAYFVHGYYAPVGAETIAGCAHGTAFAALARWRNFLAAQFHPERSATAGKALIQAFLAS